MSTMPAAQEAASYLRWLRPLAMLALLLAALFAAPVPVAQAAAITVDTGDDELNADGDCSLREAIEAANTDAVVDACTAGSGSDTITLPTGTYTLSRPGTDEDANNTGDLDIRGDLEIYGAGAASTIVDGGALDRVFEVDAAETGVTVEISGVTIQNGQLNTLGGTYGGGIHVRSTGTLILSGSVVSGSAARHGGGVYNWGDATLTNSAVSGNTAPYGAAIGNSGTLTLTNSTVSGNTSTWDGGGILNGDTLTLTNSTVSGNSAVYGGGIYNWGTSALTNSTVTSNTAPGSQGGGIRNQAGTVTLKNTIVANSASGGDCTGVITSNGYNLDSDGTCGLSGTGDLSATDPQLGPLADNGGPTQTHALLSGSPAIEAGDDLACPAADQRGVLRPVDGDGDGTATCDMGAYEYAVFVVDSTGDGADSNPGDGVCNDGGGNCTLRAAVQETVANTGPNTIVFDPEIFLPLDPPTVLIGAPLTLSGDYDTVDASDTGLTVSGAPVFSCFYITGDGNTVEGIDLITGCDHGIVIQNGAGNTIGGDTAAERNVISGNDQYGVHITGSGADGNNVKGNYIGTNAAGTAALANGEDGVAIEGGALGNTIGGATAGERNVISGNAVRGISISFSNSNSVKGNYIGTNAAGTAAIANGLGVRVRAGAQSNTIGGATAGERNVISGNMGVGVAIVSSATSSNTVKGNYIGTDATGTASVANFIGVTILSAQNNTIGGTTSGERNVISGNDSDGIYITDSLATGNKVWGNYIGTNAAGDTALANGDDGLQIDTAAFGNTIGGTPASARNVISGNSGDGVEIKDSGTTENNLEGNYIGTNKDGDSAVANGGNGVLIENGASGNTIGGIPAGGGNVISGNTGNGVEINGSGTTGNTVSANYIGTNAAGMGAIANGIGVVITGGAQSNTIGGTTTPGSCDTHCNVISGNTSDGVLISGSATTGNRIRGNSINSNGGLGIDLGADGVTANDPGDGDTGPNNLMNFPVITDVTFDGVHTTITGTLNDTPNPQNDTVDVYSNDVADGSGYGEGRVYVGSATPDTSGDWTLTVTGYPTYPIFTATATSPNPSTSEFSAAFTPFAGPPLPATAIARQGEATPIGGTFAAFGDVAVPNITGDVAFWATVTGGTAPYAIFGKPSGGSITKVVAVGDATPLGGMFSALGQPPLMNGSGDVVFWASISGGSATEGIFRWDGSLTKIAAVGDPTPVGGTYGSFSAPIGTAVPVINNDGDIAFWGTVSGVSGVTEVISLYTAATASLSKVAAVNDSTPLGGAFSTFVVSPRWSRATVPVVNNNGQVSFWGAIAGGTAPNAIFVKPSGGSIAKVAAAGESTPLGGTYAEFFVIPVANDSGDVTFWAILSGSSAGVCTTYAAECAVFQVSGGSTTKVLAAGDTGPAGVGGTITDVGVVPLMNGARQVTVWTAISNGFASEAMIRYTDGVLDNVAAAGNGTPIGGTYTDFVGGLGLGIPGINNLGQVAFRGDVSGGSGTEGIFLTDPPPSMVFEEVATAGSEAPDTGGGTFDNNFDLDINSGGQAVFRDTISGGSSSEGLFLFFAGSPVEAVAVQGDDAPASVEGQFTTFGSPVSNDEGKIVSRAATTGGDQGIFLFFAGEAVSTAQKLGAVDDDAPEPEGYVGPNLFFAGFADPAINNADRVVAKVTLDDGAGGNVREALYLFFAGEPGEPVAEPVPICLANDERCVAGPSLFFAGFADPAINENGDIAARVTLSGSGEQALYLFFAGSPGTNQLVAKEDDLAPETGLFFAGFGQRPDINFDVSLTGNVAFQASLASTPGGAVVGKGLFLFFAGSTTTKLLAEDGQETPLGPPSEWDGFGDPAINTHNQVVVRAGISGVSGVSEGIFLFFAGSPLDPVEITQIALEGDATPDGADTYGGVTDVFPFIAYNDVAQVVYVAWTEGPPVSQGVFIASLDSDEGGADGVLDFLDNCPGVMNTDQKNTDKALAAVGATVVADELGNACDADDDGDSLGATQDPGAAATLCGDGVMPQWADCIELYLTTNAVDNCPNDPTPLQGGLDDALPPDLNDDCSVNILDVFQMFPFWLGYNNRQDLNADNSVNILDVFRMFPFWLDTCT